MGNQHRSDFPGEEAFYRPQPYTLERKLLERRPFWQRHLPGIIASLSLILLIASSWTILALVTKQQFPPLQMLNTLKPKPATSGDTSATNSDPQSGSTQSGLPCSVNIQSWTDGSPDWVVHNGILYNDGSNAKPTIPSIIAPCQPGSPNYAVEAKIQLTNQVDGCFGIVLRTSYATSICNAQYSPLPDTAYVFFSNTALISNPFTPGTSLHTYRAEVRDNKIKLFIDGSLVTTATDNRLLTSETSEQVGLYCQSLQLQVTSFRVTALS